METYTFASVSQQFVRKQKQLNRNKTLISKFLKEGCATALPSALPSVLIPSLSLLLIKLWTPNYCGSSPHSFLPVTTTFCSSESMLWPYASDLKLIFNSKSTLFSSGVFFLFPHPCFFPCSYSFSIHLSVHSAPSSMNLSHSASCT